MDNYDVAFKEVTQTEVEMSEFEISAIEILLKKLRKISEDVKAGDKKQVQEMIDSYTKRLATKMAFMEIAKIMTRIAENG